MPEFPPTEYLQKHSGLGIIGQLAQSLHHSIAPRLAGGFRYCSFSPGFSGEIFSNLTNRCFFFRGVETTTEK